MEQYASDAPYTHILLKLAVMIDQFWSEDEKASRDELADFVVAAWYSDPLWAKKCATAAHAPSLC